MNPGDRVLADARAICLAAARATNRPVLTEDGLPQQQQHPLTIAQPLQRGVVRRMVVSGALPLCVVAVSVFAVGAAGVAVRAPSRSRLPAPGGSWAAPTSLGRRASGLREPLAEGTIV